ncbi:MFS transporter [Acidaminobacter sp. JC074]|uniref:MFS transporter n=1 Tax=Acidaminobacter sp. JC074 TaxID=2530199 RepID=UPI001F1192C8|nr:MFS transporter [Acidaminobacter sp. JC074]MCH4889466.1 MFS transporter [Acidaminobacter sp. JC074]
MNKEYKNLMLYTLGRTVSSLGSIIYSFAIGLYVLNTTGSGMKFAITLLVSFLPSLILTPFAGVFADRFDKKKIVVNMDILNGLLFVLFYIFITFNDISILSVYVTTFITNVITSFFGIAFEAAKPQLVHKKHLQLINSLSQIIGSIANILGPVIGGLVYAFIDIKSFILFNGISFILSALSELFIDFEFNKRENEPTHDVKDVFKDLKDGFQYVIKQRSIMGMYIFFLSVNILISLAIQVPLPYILNNHLNVGSQAYGIIFSCLPVGMILGALTVGLVLKKISVNRLYLMIGISSGFLAATIGLPYFLPGLVKTLASTMFYYGMIMLVFGSIISLVDVPFATHLQRTVDPSYLGRVWGILIPMIKVANPLGILLSGLLIELINPFLIPLIVGMIYLVFSLIGKKYMITDISDSQVQTEKILTN